MDYSFIEIGTQNENDYQENLRENYGYVMKAALMAIGDGCKDLERLIDYLREKEEALLNQRFFYDFWIVLHQRSPIVSGEN